ncbi:MAG: amidohydrolase [Chloroflexota bacterium]|nr:amidohydrolase [Chloroflexota bacterium]
MSTRLLADTILCGQVAVAFSSGRPHGERGGRIQTAEAIAIHDGRVTAVGRRTDLLASTSGARVLNFGDAAIIPGIHDFHLHLVGMARAMRDLRLESVDRLEDALAAIRAATESLLADAWLRGRGWPEVLFAGDDLGALADASAGRQVLLYSHDSHSAWASPAALAAAGVGVGTPDPPGGRIERDLAGVPTGILREAATDLVEAVAGRLRGSELEGALDETLSDMAALGITGATDAGDTTDTNGVGEYVFLGDRASLILLLRERVDGRLRLTVNLPAAAIHAAAAAGIRTAAIIADTGTLRWGWAKAYADGALGSRTAALFAPYSCGGGRDLGIMRLSPAELTDLVRSGRRAGISAAVHAIGDRAVAMALDAIEHAGPRRRGAPADRIEHAQLVRAADRPRFGELDVTASIQPIHCASDRDLAEACWADRLGDAYAYRSLEASGARLSIGTDAPIESVNPWHTLFAAVHRRAAGDGKPDWQRGETLDAATALAAMTSGPAVAAGRTDVGHLHAGAIADLAVLSTDLATLLAGDEPVADVRSLLTLVGGTETHRS